MKKLSSLQLVPGMVVAENVMSYDHQLILTTGTVLTDNLITKLDLYGVLAINVEDEDTEQAQEMQPQMTPTQAAQTQTAQAQAQAVQAARTQAAQAQTAQPQAAQNADAAARPGTTPPLELSYAARIKNSPAFQQFRKEYEANVDFFKGMINDVVERNAKLDADTLLRNSLGVIASGQGQIGILDMLQNMREYDDSTFTHCLNVALISNLFATWLKWKPEEVEMATICGLLHDVGKLSVPYDIISKPGKLSNEEYAQIKQHPISGYKLLLQQDVDDHVRYSALMHHERCDGTGYPMRLLGKQIDPYASIVAIADVYDAMTAARVYRGPMCPFRVIEIFEAEGFEKYNVKYLLVFLENVVNSYIQNRCRLSNGQVGTIIYINKNKLSKPTVQVGDEYINLGDYDGLTISELL